MRQIRHYPTIRARQIVLAGILVLALSGIPAAGRPLIRAAEPAAAGISSSSVTEIIWQTQCVDCPVRTPVMGNRSLAIDAQGRPHMVFGGDHLYYATYNSDTWHVEIVDASPNVGGYAALALDSAGRPHISFFDGMNHNLKYAAWNGRAWTIQTVDQEGDTGWYTSLALDSSDRPHIVYVRFRSVAVRHAHWTGHSWEIEDIETDTGGYEPCYPSIALDKSDQAHVSYCSGGNLKYGHQIEAGAWISQTVATSTSATSLALDSTEHPHIAYQGQDAVEYAVLHGDAWQYQQVDTAYTTGTISLYLDHSDRPSLSYWNWLSGNELKYARWNGITWEIAVAARDAYNSATSLVLDNSDLPHIGYLRAGLNFHSPAYTHWNGATWESQLVHQAGDVGIFTSLAVDRNDRPHISYHTDSAIRYAWWDGTNWHIETIDHVDDGCSMETSLALDHIGQPHIAYYDRDASGRCCLKYASRSGTTWNSQCVAVSNSNAGLAEVSLVLDSGDQPHMSYCDYGNSSLNYVRWTGAEWQSRIVDKIIILDFRTNTLALDRNDQPRLSYYSNDDRALKYAQWNDNAWVIETVDRGWFIGSFPSLALDQNGVPHISYHNALATPDGLNLKYTRLNGEIWEVQIVDASGNVGMDNSLVLDELGRPSISYYDGKYGDLKFARQDDSIWRITTVDSAGNVGMYTSMARDSTGRFHISYYDKSSGDLKYAVGSPVKLRVYLPAILQ